MNASPSISKSVTLLAGAVIVLAALAAYHNSFSAPFIFDDQSSIVENRTIRQLWPIWHVLSPPRRGGLTVEGRPLVNLSLAINYALGGTDVRGYHALNLVVHILAGLTLFGVVRRTLLQSLLRERFGAAALLLALATAVVWTVHPLQTESVTYAVQRAELLAGLFYLLTLYCFIRGADSGRGGGQFVRSRDIVVAANGRPTMWYVFSVMACLLGMASKEVMVSAPLMVLLYDRTFVAGSFREAWRRRWPLYVALASTWILLGWLVVSTVKGGGYVGGVAWWTYALTQCRAIAHYLQLSVWPHPLVFDYGSSLAGSAAEVAPHALIMALLLVGTMLSLWRWPAIGLLGVWFFAILAPTSSVVPVANQTMAEHRMYLPLAAVVTLVVIGIHALLGRRSVAVIGVLVIGFGFLTVRRNEDYRSPLAIWQDTVNKRPENPRAQLNLGNALSQAGRIEDAIRRYEEAVRIKPDSAEGHNNLGVALVEVGRRDEAIGHYEQAMRIRPEMAEGFNGLAWLLATDNDPRLRDPARAVPLAERACELTDRGDPAMLDTLAAAYAAAGRFDNAIRTAQEAITVAVTAGHEELVKEIQDRLELYKTGQPFRRKPMAAPNN